MKFSYHVLSIKEDIKKIVPFYIKVKLQLLKRSVRDVVKGYYFNYAKRRYSTNDFSNSIALKQELKPNKAKNKNLLRAIKRIEQIQINPNEILSFWRIVGNPSKKNGFTESRSLVNGKIENTIGGGLCQLSGLMYYISLIAQLEILERHNHSIDIYNEETRFTPLGSDATVAYGYKDLKIRNNLNCPIKFNFSIEDDTIKVMILHSSVIRHNVVEFKEVISDDNVIEVITIINNQVYNNSTYKKYPVV
ncbi:MAG: VanW family protein [Schleiferiaceae bacterium]|nr:VanW family protein [Schleiferiaceae bacterium]|tara:strand:- start:883 stop:1626 length:744 start_codon:yes stop_codon:yes gene_type:complete